MYPNIFVTGSQVEGESQIGYERYIEEFTNILANTNNNISITGLNRFGKTSIVKAVKKNLKKIKTIRIIPIYIVLDKYNTYGDMLKAITKEFIKELRGCQDILDDNYFNSICKEMERVDPYSQTYKDDLAELFQIAREDFNLKIVLMIDEFDAATDMFEHTADYEYIRDLSSNLDTNVNICLVSRRQLYMIEKKNFNNSTFHGIVPNRSIEGFNDEDMNKYYEVFDKFYGIEINDFFRQRLEYYCGRSPFLLSIFGYDIVDNFEQHGEFDVDDIYKKRRIDIINYYKSIQACLTYDKVDTDGAIGENCSIEKLVGIIIGPNLDVTESDIDVLEGMGYLSHRNGMYFSVSSYFSNFLRNIPLKVDTWKYIQNLEKKIKCMIRHRFNAKNNTEYLDYDWWYKVFSEIGADSVLETYDKFIADTMSEYKCNVDILDVASLEICVSILKKYWHSDFSQFFNHDNWEAWEEGLDLCASARNPLAHGHEHFILDRKNAVNEYSKKIVETIVDNGACVSEQFKLQIESNIKLYNLRETFYNLKYSNVNQQLMNKIVEFYACEQCAKGIKGYVSIDGKFYSCTIGKKKWTDKFRNNKLSQYLGNTYNVIVNAVNPGQNTIQIDFV